LVLDYLTQEFYRACLALVKKTPAMSATAAAAATITKTRGQPLLVVCFEPADALVACAASVDVPAVELVVGDTDVDTDELCEEAGVVAVVDVDDVGAVCDGVGVPCAGAAELGVRLK
jgi:hypothetical protein